MHLWETLPQQAYSLALWDSPDQCCHHKECRLLSQGQNILLEVETETSNLGRMREKPVKGIGNAEVGC